VTRTSLGLEVLMASPQLYGRGASRATPMIVGSPPDPIYIFAVTPLKVAAGPYPPRGSKARVKRSWFTCPIGRRHAPERRFL
jgi:hypothetical protein